MKENPKVQGTWPEHCIQRAFSDGAKWWLWHSTGFTAFSSELDEMADEAVRRFGEPITVDRKPEWRQDTPKQQAQILLGSAEEYLIEGSLNRAIGFMRQAQELLQKLPDATTWTEQQQEND